MIDRMLPMIAGDSAPIYLAARYWLIKETLPTNKAKNRFLGSDFSLGSVRKSNTNGIRNMRTDNCNTTLVLRFRTSRFVSFASTSTGVPIAPKAVATLFAIKLTVAENIGLNPRLIRIPPSLPAIRRIPKSITIPEYSYRWKWKRTVAL